MDYADENPGEGIQRIVDSVRRKIAGLVPEATRTVKGKMNDRFAAALDIFVCFWYNGSQEPNGKTCRPAPSNDDPILEDRHVQNGFQRAPQHTDYILALMF